MFPYLIENSANPYSYSIHPCPRVPFNPPRSNRALQLLLFQWNSNCFVNTPPDLSTMTLIYPNCAFIPTMIPQPLSLMRFNPTRGTLLTIRLAPCFDNYCHSIHRGANTRMLSDLAAEVSNLLSFSAINSYY